MFKGTCNSRRIKCTFCVSTLRADTVNDHTVYTECTLKQDSWDGRCHKLVIRPCLSVRCTDGYSKGKGKAIPLQALCRPLGFQEVEAPKIYRQSALEDGKVVSLTHRPPLPPREDSWYTFLLEAEVTPGPHCGQKY